MTTRLVTVDAKAFDHAAAALSEAGFEEVAVPIVKNALRRSANVVRTNVKKRARRHHRSGRLEAAFIPRGRAPGSRFSSG
jgi:cytosine/adenosine deaminase-related metal-dependent hydrolase